MRIISGIKRGMNLFSPTSDETRPTTDRVRENIFNLIRFDLAGANVLDLFAGSGAMGIEALSGGALGCTFVDNSNKAYDIILKNINKAGFNDKSKIYRKSFEKFIDESTDKFDIIFLDPPYHNKYVDLSMKMILKKGLDKKNCLFVIETDFDENINLPEGYIILKEKIYGRVKVTLAKRGDKVWI